MVKAVLGVDIGTSSSKGVLVDSAGAIMASADIQHTISHSRVGFAEMDPQAWWDEFVYLSRKLMAGQSVEIAGVGVSGMGPCVAVATAQGVPLRPAILYGIDTRATKQIAELNQTLGGDAIRERCGSALSSQAVGPKLLWIRQVEPHIWASVNRLFMPSSWLVFKLTGEYVLDHHSASQSAPLYDIEKNEWIDDWAGAVAPGLSLPRLLWPGEVAGTVTTRASIETAIPEGTPVIAGTIDAWAEAASIGALNPGDLMLMYGTTMFLIHSSAQRTRIRNLWNTAGIEPMVFSAAAGMATSGAITSWLRGIFGSPGYEDLLDEAVMSGVGANGLLMLPYFAGERTPISDPYARGVIVGLTTSTSRGDLYRAALEATAYGVLHNVHAIETAATPVKRVVAVGGGTQGGVWTQIVSDVIGRPQFIPAQTVGASYGAAYLIAHQLFNASIAQWNPITSTIEPDLKKHGTYLSLFEQYLALYPATQGVVHHLAQHALWDQ